MQFNLILIYLGHFKLTIDLLDVLYLNGPSRIITVTSDTYIFGNIDLEKARGKNFHRWWAYCDSKLANILFVRALHNRLKSTDMIEKIKVFAVHPGSVSSGIARGTNTLINWIYQTKFVKILMGLQNTKVGASGSVYVSLSKDVENSSGKYFSKTNEQLLRNFVTKQTDTEEILWKFSEEATNSYFVNLNQ